MEAPTGRLADDAPDARRAPRRWHAHAAHGAGHTPHLPPRPPERLRLDPTTSSRNRPLPPVALDGSHGEGGGQILRTALALSMLTGRAFHIRDIRANREKPGLRPQHLAAVRAAAALCGAEVRGDAPGSPSLAFRPGPIVCQDMDLDIGTAGATGLVLQTLALPLAWHADQPVRLVLRGGTFNTQAPSYPFLGQTWRRHLGAMGLAVGLAMPEAGFYPRGGGRLEAWIEPGRPRALTLVDRGPLQRIRGLAGTCRLPAHVAQRMATQAEVGLTALGVPIQIEPANWTGPAPGAALALTAEYAGSHATFVGLGRPGLPAEMVADQAVAALRAHDQAAGAVDAHSADQILLPLALAQGASTFSVTHVTDHLRTNIHTVRAFLDRRIQLEEPDDGPARVRIA